MSNYNLGLRKQHPQGHLQPHHGERRDQSAQDHGRGSPPVARDGRLRDHRRGQRGRLPEGPALRALLGGPPERPLLCLWVSERRQGERRERYVRVRACARLIRRMQIFV